MYEIGLGNLVVHTVGEKRHIEPLPIHESLGDPASVAIVLVLFDTELGGTGAGERKPAVTGMSLAHIDDIDRRYIFVGLIETLNPTDREEEWGSRPAPEDQDNGLHASEGG